MNPKKIGRTCIITLGAEEKFKQEFYWENFKESSHLGEKEVDIKVLLK
jgi:hypothetical protein